MLFTVTPPPSDGAAAATAATVDEFTTTGNTLTQLQNFFEHHTFDTAGPYSDLFSVLLSCCKHLVDTNLHHHAVLSNQKHEVGRLSSETEALCDVAARCQEGIRELKSSSLDPRLVERRIQSPSPPVSAVTETAAAAAAAHNADIELLRGRLDEVYGHVRESQASVRETRLRQADLERQSADERRRQQQAEEQFRHLEEDVAKLKRGVSAHADYVDGEVAAMRNTAASSSTDRGPALKSYTDKKIKALRNELCIALQEAVLAEDVVGPSAPAARSPRRSARAAAPTAARRVAERGGGDDNDNDDDDEGDAPRDALAAGLRQLVSRTSRAVPARLEQLESRVESLEVYAPHYCAMAARPPLLGVELRDEKGVGVRVDKVFRGFAGEAAGMAPGDIVIAVNGQEVLTRAEMYAVMTELARENQSRCRLLMQQYYEEYAERKGISTGGVVNRNDDHGFIAKSGRAAAFENDGRWELPRLELRFHLKCGGVLRETAIIVETDNDALK